MAVRKHVFGSNAERAASAKLKQRWGDRFTLYTNLPFLMVFNTMNLVDISAWPDAKPMPHISDLDLGRLKKTSIDFTLCDANDAPLVCIEFDGMQEGFNVGTRYRAAEPTDPWRDQIMYLKLKVAHGSLFPYFVVGTEQFKDISDVLKLSILDAVIGSVLAGKALHERTSNFDPSEIGVTTEDFEQLSPIDQDELIEAWFIGAEADADLTYNPVFEAEFNLWRDLRKRLGSMRHTVRYLFCPSLDSAKTPIERANLMRKAILHGAE